jgi:hypothetical protein
VFPKDEDSTRSKIILIIAKAGMQRNIPEIPQNCSPMIMPIKEKKH